MTCSLSLSRPQRLALLLGSSVLLLAGGCNTLQPEKETLSAAVSARAYGERSLNSEDLRSFFGKTLKRDLPGTWDFDDLYWAAIHYNPGLAVARAQWETAQASLVVAGERANPTLSLVPGYNTTRTPGVSPWMPALSLDFLLPTGGKRLRQQDIAKADAEYARLSFLAVAWQLRSDLKLSLLEAHQAEDRAKRLQVLAALQEKQTERISERVDAGLASPQELSTARAACIRSQATLADAQAAVRSARSRLAACLGISLASLPTQEALPVPPLFTVPGSDALMKAREHALTQRADLLASLAKFASAQAAVELEVARRYPDFHLGPGYQWDQGNNKWTLSAGFEIPLFHNNNAAIQEAVARRHVAANEFIKQQAEELIAIEASALAVQAAGKQAEQARLLLAESRAQHAKVNERLKQGASDALELMTAEADTASAELAYEEAQAAGRLAAVQLEAVLQPDFPHLEALAGDSTHPSK